MWGRAALCFAVLATSAHALGPVTYTSTRISCAEIRRIQDVVSPGMRDEFCRLYAEFIGADSNRTSRTCPDESEIKHWDCDAATDILSRFPTSTQDRILRLLDMQGRSQYAGEATQFHRSLLRKNSADSPPCSAGSHAIGSICYFCGEGKYQNEADKKSCKAW
jgi:hypothetical protein